ncbi:MAG: hypothetical protein B7Y51_00315, partial [Burkholderiales bacterium 28-67-8]
MVLTLTLALALALAAVVRRLALWLLLTLLLLLGPLLLPWLLTLRWRAFLTLLLGRLLALLRLGPLRTFLLGWTLLGLLLTLVLWP